MPVHDTALDLDVLRAAALVAVGVVAGVLAGLVGVGGGSVVVPGLELVAGTGDLLARGTSLLVMVPTALTGTWSNLRHGLVDPCTGVLVGAAAALAAPLGVQIGRATSELQSPSNLVCRLLLEKKK